MSIRIVTSIGIDETSIRKHHQYVSNIVDLATLLFSYNYGSTKRQRPLTIIGGKGIKIFMHRLYRLYPWIEPIDYDFVVKTMPKGKLIHSGLTIITSPVEHRTESIAVRLEENGKSAVFSGDTDTAPSLIDLAQDADLLVLECTYPLQKERGHLNLVALKEIVTQARPDRVILTHLDPQWEDYHSPLPAPLLLGEDCMEIEV